MQGWCVGWVGGDIFFRSHTNTSDTLALVISRRTRTGLIIVVDDIHVHALTTIATVTAEIINHIITHIHPFVQLCGGARTQTRGTTGMMDNHVVMERGTRTSPVATIAMVTLAMTGIYKTLCHQAPLYSGILIT